MERSLNFAETVSSMYTICGYGSLLVCINFASSLLSSMLSRACIIMFVYHGSGCEGRPSLFFKEVLNYG